MNNHHIYWNVALAFCLSACIGGVLALVPAILLAGSPLVYSRVGLVVHIGTLVFAPFTLWWVKRLSSRARSYLWLGLVLLWLLIAMTLFWLFAFYFRS